MRIGSTVILLPTCESTNTYLMDLSQKSPQQEGFLVRAFQQTAGRGQRGNSWESTPNLNLTLSFLAYPHFLALHEIFVLNMAIALGVHDFLCQYIAPNLVSIKYPNDLLIENKKIGGILIENAIKGEAIDRTVVGIGLNVNQTTFTHPRATSLSKINAQQYDLRLLQASLCTALENAYNRLENKDYQQIKADYLAKNFQFGELCTYYTPTGAPIEATITDIKGGEIILSTLDNKQHAYGIKEIAYFKD
jgi:BirA family transcriptional regulator, biotin operon repressor / biotin---[acetyl-CoA-carboxylase] ligase